MLVAVLLGAAPAAAGPWRVEPVRTAGPAIGRAVDVLPSGRSAVLLQRRTGGVRRLELRAGASTRLLDSSDHGFFNAELRHDRRGRLAAVWAKYVEGTPRVFAWTAAAGRQAVSGGGSPSPSLAVAPNGRAALAYWSGEGVFLSRGSTARGFAAAEALGTTTFPAPPGVGVTDGGRIVVAWIGDGEKLDLREARPGAPPGPRQVVSLRPAAPGASLVRRPPKVVTTSDGRAIVVVSSLGSRDDKTRDSRLDALDWAADAAHPSTPASLSRAAGAGEADVVARGRSAVIAWTQRPKGTRRSLWAARWGPSGVQRPHVFDTNALGLPVRLAAGPKGAVRAFYRVERARWFTVPLSATGLYGEIDAVTPAADEVGTLDVAGTGSHVAATWTRGGRQVQLARPAR